MESLIRQSIDTRLEQIAEDLDNAQIAEAAIDYIVARRKQAEAETANWEQAIVEVDRTYYTLLKACGFIQEESF